VLYAFSRPLYRLFYGIGALIIAGYAQQFYAGFNFAFFMQTGLIFLIGIGLFSAHLIKEDSVESW
jgi:hypothetical protein